MPRTPRPGRAPAHQSWRRAPLTGALAALGLASVLVLSACAGGSSDVPGAKPTPARGPVLNLYAYSVAKPAYDAVTEAYAQTPEGSQITLLTSYGASGDQSRKVAAGAPADIVSFSITPDVTRLVDAGMVDAGWDAGPDRGVPLSSVVVFVVREGNPQGIHDWSDLLRPGIDVVTPNPLSSGSAQWNLMAPYAVASRGGQNPQAGLDYVRALVTQHVTTRPSSGSEATETFRQGHGDVLLSYENEAIIAQRRGDAFDHVVPPQTLRIENPVAVVSASPHRAEAQRFVDHLATPAAQQTLAESGFRPVDEAVAQAYAEQYPPPDKLWTVADLGGWTTVTRDLFAQQTGAITSIYREATR